MVAPASSKASAYENFKPDEPRHTTPNQADLQKTGRLSASPEVALQNEGPDV